MAVSWARVSRFFCLPVQVKDASGSNASVLGHLRVSATSMGRCTIGSSGLLTRINPKLV